MAAELSSFLAQVVLSLDRWSRVTGVQRNAIQLYLL